MPWGKPRNNPRPEPKPSGNGQRPSSHQHDWRETRRRAITRGPFKGKTMVFWVCDAPGCPNPDKSTWE
jgi:hypothetical protein